MRSRARRLDVTVHSLSGVPPELGPVTLTWVRRALVQCCAAWRSFMCRFRRRQRRPRRAAAALPRALRVSTTF
jgi:hypothetical protein